MTSFVLDQSGARGNRIAFTYRRSVTRREAGQAVRRRAKLFCIVYLGVAFLAAALVAA